jgi:hypothetical protein
VILCSLWAGRVGLAFNGRHNDLLSSSSMLVVLCLHNVQPLHTRPVRRTYEEISRQLLHLHWGWPCWNGASTPISNTVGTVLIPLNGVHRVTPQMRLLRRSLLIADTDPPPLAAAAHAEHDARMFDRNLNCCWCGRFDHKHPVRATLPVRSARPHESGRVPYLCLMSVATLLGSSMVLQGMFIFSNSRCRKALS